MKLKRAVDIQSLFFYVFLSLPLFYIFDHPVISRTLRFSVLFGLLLLIFSIAPALRIFTRNLCSLKRPYQIGIGGFVVLQIVSALVANNGIRTTVFGINPEYLGLVSWLAFIGLAIFFADRLREFLLSKITLIILLATITLSLVGSYYEIMHGLRIPGVMFQATTLGMYATFTAVIGLWQLRVASASTTSLWPTLLSVLSAVVVILTQSRIATMTFVLVFGIIALHAVLAHKRQILPVLIASILMVIVAVTPKLSSNYFARFQSDSVGSGVQYRLELYKLTTADVLHNNLLLGNGPSSLPDSINNESMVPEDIQLSLRVGDVFLSSHNMYLDIGNCFGLIAVLIVVWLSVAALKRGIVSTDTELWLLFCTAIANALLNVTSLELTSWYFVLLIALLVVKKPARKQT